MLEYEWRALTDEYADMIVEHSKGLFDNTEQVWTWYDRILVCFLEGVPVGAVWWETIGHALEPHFCTFPAGKGKVIYNATVEFLTWASEMEGVMSIYSYVRADDLLAQRFDKKIGFKQVGRIPHYYGECDALVYWLEELNEKCK